MTTTRLFQLLALLLILFSATDAATSAPRPELRAFWADGFSDGFKTPQQVDELVQRLHDAHCNAIFAQMRKGGDAYYASHYEPWAFDDPTHFDALAYLIEKAHAQNPPIAVHAWINTCAVGKGKSLPLTHIAQRHPDWLSVNPHNNPDDNEAYKIDPGNPGAADWTFRVYLDVARHYSVDGIHFDFVRYGAKTWGYNPVSVARFNQRVQGKSGIVRLPDTDLPDPADPTWKQWRRDQVTALVRKIYAHAAQVNPALVVSAAVITWGDGPKSEAEWFTKSAAMNRVYQDWQSWLKEGMIDLACPMTYFQEEYAADSHRHWSEFIKNHQYKRAATIAVGNWFNTVPQTFRQMQVARQPSAKGKRPYGVMLYSYAGTNLSEEKDEKGKRKEQLYQPEFYAALSQPSKFAASPPFAEVVPLPPMAWKVQPKAGHLKGFVLTPQLDPVDGATITVRHGKRIYRRVSDGTGFYALIDLPPGEYKIKVQAPGYAAQEGRTKIEAGKVATAQFTLGGAAIPLTGSLAALRGRLPGTLGAAEGTPVRLNDLTVTLGSDIFPDNLYVTDASGFGLRVRLANAPVLPFQAGDVVAIVGTLRNVDGEPTIDAAAARLTDILPARALPAPLETTGRAIAEGKVLGGALVRVVGDVREANTESFAIEGDTEMWVWGGGLKEFGVEGKPLVFAPMPGTRVAVTGIATVALSSGGTRSVRIRPLSLDDVKVLPSVALLPWQSPWARRTAISFVVLSGLAVAAVQWKRNRKPLL